MKSTCQTCGERNIDPFEHYHVPQAEDVPLLSPDGRPTPDLIVPSCGAGVQSTAIILLAIDGVLPKPDVAIFADTGWEPAAVYAQVDRLADALATIDVPLLRVSNGNLRLDAVDPDHRYASIPYFVQKEPGPCDPCAATGVLASELGGGEGDRCGRCRGTGWFDGKGMGRRQCTSEYKLAPITRKVRELLGAKPPYFRRVPKGRVAEQWVGFSTDEVERANRRKDSQGVSYLTTRYPLLDLGMSRDDCIAYLTSKGWGDTEKSACIGCPYHGNRQWRELRDTKPDEWADAVKFDEAIRKGGSRGLPLNGEAFLHRSRLPLSIAPIDHVTRVEADKDYAAGQPSLLDLIEDGEPNGCSPYGCRSDLVGGHA